jgi:Spermidine/putrescine-binding periplasmic protein
MKKLLCFLLAALSLAACSSDRSQVLKIYNWSSYIDEALIGEFEQWYEEQTGEKVKVVYQTFDINETMLSKIEKGHEDFDAVCPSDYIIERMLKNDLLLPIDRDFGQTPDYISGSLSPYVINQFGHMAGDTGKNVNEYAVGYMWGFTGFLYNKNKVDAEDVKTWNVIHNEKYSGMIFIKDAPRDVYSQLLIYFNQDKVKRADGTFDLEAMDSLMHDSSEKSLAQVEEYLSSARDLIGGWEADFGKEIMTQERALVNLTWSGDAAWAIDEAAKVGVDLGYAVPEEGATVWFDGWVIPKYAKNVKAARYFINFMCKPENAIRNSEEIGYSSACGAPEMLEALIDDSFEPIDLSYFFGEGADSVCVNPVMFADKSVIDRCPMEHDWSPQDTERLIAMWSRVKGDGASSLTYIIIGAVALAIGGALYARFSSKNKRGKKRRR